MNRRSDRTTSARADRRFVRLLLVVLLLALAVRVGYVAFAKKGPCNIVRDGQVVSQYHSECTGQNENIPNDQLYYNLVANQLAAGEGFVGPFGDHPQLADHPPLTSVVLSGVSWLFDHPPLNRLADTATLPDQSETHTFVREQRYLMALIGTFNVFLIALLGRRVGGSNAGLLAAFLAAIYPNLWVNDGLLFAETIAITTVVASLLLALRCGRDPRTRNFVALGAMCALAALTRAELLLLAPLLVVPVAWARRGGNLGLAIGRVAASALAVVVVMAPWFVYNQSRFDETVLNSTNDGLALAGSYCDRVFYGESLGLWATDDGCAFTPEYERTLGDQSKVSKAYRTKAFDYLSEHKSRLPVVVAARIGRAWSFYKPAGMIDYNEGENREAFVAWPGLIMYYLLLVPAGVGLWALWKCKERLAAWVLVVPALTVTAVVAVTYGQTRFRATAEPSLVVLAALGLLWTADGIRQWRDVRRAGDSAPVG